MMPYIWKHAFGLDWLTIHSYGAMAVVALLMATWLLGRESRRAGLDPDRMFNLAILLFLVGLIGARALYIVVRWETYKLAPAADVFKVWQGGLVWYGGILAALPFGLIWLKHKKLPLWDSADLLYMATIFGLGFARGGCLLAGCCYGEACELPWAITYSHPEAIVVQELGQSPTPHLHPTPIYSALIAFSLTGIMLLIQRRKRFPGQVLAVGLALYALARFFLEYLRGDDGARGAVELGGLTLSTSQLIGVGIFVVAVWLHWRLAKLATPKDAEATA
jgi:phosphatidylglycerol:prolipoprotein diacylglycerol transferase